MIKHKDHFHGSDLEKIEQIYGIRKEEIVSFSANVNPLGVSPLVEVLRYCSYPMVANLIVFVMMDNSKTIRGKNGKGKPLLHGLLDSM